MTDKQITAVKNLLRFINGVIDDDFTDSESWWHKFDWINNGKHLKRAYALPPTCRETQNIFSFLINSMKKCNHYAQSPRNHQNQLDRINAESVMDGYWDNPLF